MPVQRAYRFRFYPTPEQADMLARTFGCVRFVYNHFLARRQARYLDGLNTRYGEDASALTALKRDPQYAWLKEVSSVALQQSLRHLDTAFQRFFTKQAKHPTFKRKNGRASASLMANAFTLEDGRLTLAKMREPLDVRWSRPLPAKPSSLTVSRDAAGRYFVSLLCEEAVESLPVNHRAIGVDLGLTDFIVRSDDAPAVPAPKFLRTLLTRVRHLSRALARKQKGSKNRHKARQALARLHARIADARNDFLHQLSTRLLRENQAVFVETLSITGLLKTRLARSIGDAAWGTFLGQLKYKAEWYGRLLWQAPRHFASSKTCHACGYKLKALPLSVRHWTCPDCGSAHQRDKNAALNLLLEGQRQTGFCTAGLAGT